MSALTPDRLQAFARADRASRRVRRLRYLLPLASLLLVGLVVGVTVVSRLAIDLKFGALKISAAGLSMDSPKLSGSDGKGRTYEVSAASALQSLTDTNIIHLSGIAAHVREADGRFADFTADGGVYDAKAQLLTLTDNLVLHGSDGSQAHLDKAMIDLNSGAVQSDTPVAFSSSLGNIEASKMGANGKSGAVTFGGGVKMTVNPGAVKSGIGGTGLIGTDAPQAAPQQGGAE